MARAGRARWLVDRLAAEERQRDAVRHHSVMQALLNPRVLALALVYFGAVAVHYGVSFCLPQIVKAFGADDRRDRLGLGDPVCGRRGQHRLVGPALRQQDGAQGHLPIALPSPRSASAPRRRSTIRC